MPSYLHPWKVDWDSGEQDYPWNTWENYQLHIPENPSSPVAFHSYLVRQFAKHLTCIHVETNFFIISSAWNFDKYISSEMIGSLILSCWTIIHSDLAKYHILMTVDPFRCSRVENLLKSSRHLGRTLSLANQLLQLMHKNRWIHLIQLIKQSLFILC